MDKICEINECTACRACMNICPANAIYMSGDRMERECAVIDEEKCIGCDACVKTCPNNREINFHIPLKCFAMRTKEDRIKEICSSGGIASTLGKYMVLNGGVYFGAKGFPVCIDTCMNEKEVLECSGSKYTESSTGNSYREVKKYLLSDKSIVYVGTPCQCAGLLTYLGKDYDNLITIDLVCHGVPPKSYFQQYIKKMNATSVSFRSENKFQIKVKDDNGTLWISDSYHDPYYNLFLQGVIFRENCYNCKYAKKERVADFTIGDFWGLDKATLENVYDGNISLCLVNTQKGLKLFEDIKHLFVWEERKVEEAIQGNAQLQYASKTDEMLRLQFEKECKRKGSRYAIMHSGFGKRARKYMVKSKIKKLLCLRKH